MIITGLTGIVTGIGTAWFLAFGTPLITSSTGIAAWLSGAFGFGGTVSETNIIATVFLRVVFSIGLPLQACATNGILNRAAITKTHDDNFFDFIKPAF